MPKPKPKQRIVPTVLVKDQKQFIDQTNWLTNNSGRDKTFTSSKYKPFIRRTAVVPDVINPLPHWDCIKCLREYAGMVGSLKGRILRGYRVKINKKLVIVDSPLPGNKPFPAYARGRVCNECAKQYTITNTAPQYGELQPLRDVIELTKRHTVTQATVEHEDEDQERATAQAVQDKAGFIRAGRIKIPLGVIHKPDKNAPRINTECILCPDHDGTNVPRCSECNAPTEQVVEKLHVNSFRRFMASRGGKRSYDIEVNFANARKPRS